MNNSCNEDNVAVFNAARKISEERYKLYSKKKFIENLTTKFKTTMIGALAAVEEHFGELWGKNTGGPRTNEEREWFNIYQGVRNQVLNNGNNQLRAMLNELSLYTLTWNKYHTDLIIKKDRS